MRANLKALAVTALLVVCFGAQTGHAGPVGALTNFNSGTPALASEVNGNFSAVKSAVDDNAAQIAASVVCPANSAKRFTDKGDGTICDSETGLMWEKKTGTVGAIVTCGSLPACPDPHDVNNVYTWSAASPEPNGTLYTNFLARLNLAATDDFNATCFASHCDWRVPTVSELRSIQTSPCGTSPCIDSAFGPTASSLYWSSSSLAGSPDNAWLVDFAFVGGAFDSKASPGYVRAVRGGR
jgi:hypothetical protein